MGAVDKMTIGELLVGNVTGFADLGRKAGTGDIADSDAAQTIALADCGKLFKSALDGASKTVTLPVFDRPGQTIDIVLTAALVASGVLTLNLGSGQTFDTGSRAFFTAGSSTATLSFAAATNNKLTLTGAATNNSTALGSTVSFVYLGENKVRCVAEGLKTGTGLNAALAFGTQA